MRNRFALALAILMAAQPLAAQEVQEQVDTAFEAVATAVAEAGLDPVVSIDHARLADKEGVAMPASRVQIFSDAGLDSAILAAEIRAGLDLPLRVLAYDREGALAVMATDSAFLMARHGLVPSDALSGWDDRLDAVLIPVADRASMAPVSGLTKDYGIIELPSAYGLAESIQRLKDAILSQGDTVWFGEQDFRARAEAHGVSLPSATLLLFGGPAPGGVAMAEFPSIGLDAFCQKLFLYEREDGTVIALFNGISALAELHYGKASEAHQALDTRLTQTFTEALARK